MRYPHHMARQRRGGFRPPELRGTLGTLIRTAAPAVRDVLERGVREGRARLDDALSGRRRSDALAELGEIVLDLVRRGEIDIAELPEIQDIVAHLDQLDTEHPDPDPEPPPAPRKRFDDRAPRAKTRNELPARSRGRPTRDDRRPAAGDDDRDAGTVSSRTWTPPRTQPARVWRPPAAGDTAPSPARPADEITARERPNPLKKGGISFDDDDDSDLAEYMHPDDVPPKPTEGD